MKESIGGTWLFTIVIVFLALFTTFVSVTTNYARCFKIKDDVVDKITYAKGINETSITEIRDRLRNLGYSSTGECPNDGNCWWGFSVSESTIAPAGYGSDVNFCIRKTEIIPRAEEVNGMVNGSVDRFPSAYYSVVIFFKLDWPIIRQIFQLKITGETPIILLPKDIQQVQDTTGCRVGE